MNWMTPFVLMSLMLTVPAGHAEMRGVEGPLNEINPAAGPEEGSEEPTLLDQKVEELKSEAKAADDDGEVVAEAPVRKGERKGSGESVALSGLKVLSKSDASAYKAAFARARRGEAPNLKVDDEVLAGDVKALYLLRKKGTTFSELNGWLKDYRDLPVADDVYDMAQAKRERPREVCKTETVTRKVETKKKNKDGSPKVVTKKSKKRVCNMVGKLGPAPIVPEIVERKEARRLAREAARAEDLSKLSAEGRQVVGQSWRLRGQGKYSEALKVLMAPGARVEAGNEYWQAELVKIADYHHGQRDWKALLRAAEPAASVNGPQRDDALWLAGYARYVSGDKAKAAEHWVELVENEPVGGVHFARAAWWGARVLSENGEEKRAKALLQAGAKDGISFYGQLCAAKLGKSLPLDWSSPEVDARDFATLQRVPAAKRGFALAQIGEISLAQRQLRMANEDLPYNATRALAASALKMGLPATALFAGKQLKEQGDVLAPALFPLAEDWSPNGGWKYDRALMLGIMRQESAFNPQIGSRVGAQGLMQIMPATGKYIARLTGHPLPDKADLHDPGINLALAQSYLKYLSDRLDGNQMLVVAAYNGGIGNVQRWMARGVTPGHDPVLWLESIPFDETRDYVEKVFANYWLYQQRMGVKAWSLEALAGGYWPMQWGRLASK